MGTLYMLVALSSMVLASSLPRESEKTYRQQNIAEYFPDFRYPDKMVNPSFMTARCTSEGVFPHPYSCTWFYRCHDRTGHGAFYTSYFICEPGTVFDDYLDQCVHASSVTCSKDVGYCRIQKSSCRFCQVGSSQQELCEFEECYSSASGQLTGIRRLCDEGQLYNGENCVEDCRKCSPREGIAVLPSCQDNKGCLNGERLNQTLCEYFTCDHSGSKQFNCEVMGQLFNPDTKTCQEKLKLNECPCVPVGDSCKFHTGIECDTNKGVEVQFQKILCDYYKCDQRTTSIFTCEKGSLFDPSTKTCKKMKTFCESAATFCTTDTSTCKDHADCETSTIITKTLCTQENCKRTGNQSFKRDLCPENEELFDIIKKKCVSTSNLCLKRETPKGQGGSQRTPAPATIVLPPTSCSIVVSSCQVHNVCKPTNSTMILCELERCEREGQFIAERSMCTVPGHAYEMNSRRCVQKPTGTELC